MAQYRVSELDLSTRMAIGLEMLQDVGERGWGRVTELARIHNVSRTLLYKIRGQVQEALTRELSPKSPGPKPETEELVLDEELIRRAITVLPMVQGSVRGIQTGLALLFGVERSVGYIHATLEEIGQRAEAYNQALMPTGPILGEVDEIFCGGAPCLTVVDGESFVVLNISAADARDETTWGVTFLDLLEQGVVFHDVAADGALGIKAGMKAAELDVPLRPDLFHLMQDGTKISQRLERIAYKAMETTIKAWNALDDRTNPKPKRGRPRQSKLSPEEAEAQEMVAIDTVDNWNWLLKQLRQRLEPITPTGQIASTAAIRETVHIITDLMQQLGRDDISEFATSVTDKIDLLLAPISSLEESLAPLRIDLNAETEAAIIREWQQRKEHQLSIQELFPPSLCSLAQAFWDALDRFHRSSSLAESFHSWLRPFLELHRSLPDWLASLLQLFWNNHRFQRGKRAGHTPLELAFDTPLLSLSSIIDWLVEAPTNPIS